MGWDSMLRANTRRASTMNSVWLREEADANWGNNGGGEIQGI